VLEVLKSEPLCVIVQALAVPLISLRVISVRETLESAKKLIAVVHTSSK